MNDLIQVWKFDPRQAVDPKTSASEWLWVVDWARAQSLQGKAYAVRTTEMDGEYLTATFVVYEGQTTKRDSETRNL